MCRLSTSKTPLPDNRLPLVVVVGATAVGKTEIAIRVAEALEGEIVSADSRLFYRGMDIGTAKPDAAERARVPHHLIDVAEPDERWSLPMFQERAAEAIEDICARGKLPLLVGGTGQYVWAVIESWLPPSQGPDTRLRAALEAWAGDIGAFELHRRLHVLDPMAAEGIDPRNLRRTVRALEVILHSGKLFSAQRQKKASPYHLLLVGLTRPRADLYARIDARIQAMLDGGFVDEAKALLAKGYSPDLPTFSAIGYQEMIASLNGTMSLEEAVMQMKRLTRRYVRQQGAWFREEDPSIHWFDVQEDTSRQIISLVKDWLASLAARDGAGD
jgi:tRNA dimethylallyltransferase